MFCLMLMASIAGAPFQSSDTITVGHPALRGASLTLGTDTTEVYVVRDGTRKLVSTSTVNVARAGENYVVVFIGPTRAGATIDSVVISATTLAPVRHVEVMPDHRATFNFSQGRITGNRDSAGVKAAIDLSVAENRFDFSVLQSVMDRLPLSQGYSAIVLAYDVSTRKDRAVTVSVVGKEAVEAAGASTDAWKTSVDFGTHQVTRWIAIADRRELRWEISRGEMKMEGLTKRGT